MMWMVIASRVAGLSEASLETPSPMLYAVSMRHLASEMGAIQICLREKLFLLYCSRPKLNGFSIMVCCVYVIFFECSLTEGQRNR